MTNVTNPRRKTLVIREHVVPIGVAVRKLKEFMEVYRPIEDIKEFLSEHCVMCLIHVDEEPIVDQYKRTMPDEGDLWSRYKAVGVEPIGLAEDIIDGWKAPGGGNSTHTKFRASSLEEVAAIVHTTRGTVETDWLYDAIFSGFMFLPECKWYVTKRGACGAFNQYPKFKSKVDNLMQCPGILTGKVE